jgi:hemoglobin
MIDKSLYERLGGVYGIAAIVDHFSDATVKDPIIGQGSKNPALQDWHAQRLGRLAGRKFMLTAWLCDVAGGPIHFTPTKPGATPLGLEGAHHEFAISPGDFEAFTADLARSLDVFKVPEREKDEVLALFAARQVEVTEGSLTLAGTR